MLWPGMFYQLKRILEPDLWMHTNQSYLAFILPALEMQVKLTLRLGIKFYTVNDRLDTLILAHPLTPC